MKRVLKMSKLAIPYRRYSSDLQTGNSSLERQQQMINQWLTSPEGMEYTTSSAYTYLDEGVSGYSGSHIEKGDFGRFLEDMRKGVFGRYDSPTLLIENVDRFGRQKATKTVGLLDEIVNEYGINIRFLNSSKTITSPIGDTELLIFVVESMRSHGESLRKSEMVGKAWEMKQDRILSEGKTLTKNVPWWVNPADRYDIESSEFKERQDLIRDIFKKRLAGMSCNKIATVLNENGKIVPTNRTAKADKEYKRARSRGAWNGALVSSTLANRAVMGYLAPQANTASNSIVTREIDPITEKVTKSFKLKEGKILRPEVSGYFPEIINHTLFAAVSLLKEDQAGRKRSSGLPNSVGLFKKLLMCSACGLPISVYGSRESYPGVYQCSGTRAKSCDQISISRKDVDAALLNNLIPNLSKLNINDSLAEQLATLENQRDRLIEEAGNLYAVAKVAGMNSQLTKLITDNTKEQSDLNTQIDALTTKRNASEYESLNHLNLDLYEDRVQAQVIIKRMIKSIFLDTDQRKMDITLVNGSQMLGFEIDRNVSLKLVTNIMMGVESLPEYEDPRLNEIYQVPKSMELDSLYLVADNIVSKASTGDTTDQFGKFHEHLKDKK